MALFVAHAESSFLVCALRRDVADQDRKLRDAVAARAARFENLGHQGVDRDNDFLYSFKADEKTGALTPIGRSNCGGKIPRNFVLDPMEHWMLVANQDSNNVSVFTRNLDTGVLAENGKSFAAASPMCILFL